MSPDGVTPLMEAAANNHISILQLLLDARADISVVNCIGRTALMEAACRGHPAITLRLCQARPDLNYRNMKHPLELTSLMEAASRGHTGVVFWLCEARADLNMVSKWNDTALIMAAHNNRFDAVRVLVAQRANIDICGDNQLTALETALSRGFTKIVSFLSDPQIRDPEYCDTLYKYFKDIQKRQLQDEVNYDASVSSRKPFPPVLFPELPTFKQSLIPIPIPKGRPQQSPDPSDTALLRHLYDTYNKPRRYPLRHLPPFRYCQWVAIEPTRWQRHSRKARTDTFTTVCRNNPPSSSQYPVLTLFDNGHWVYSNDLMSGTLHGYYNIFQIVSHGTMKYVDVKKAHSDVDGAGGEQPGGSMMDSDDHHHQNDHTNHLGFTSVNKQDVDKSIPLQQQQQQQQQQHRHTSSTSDMDSHHHGTHSRSDNTSAVTPAAGGNHHTREVSLSTAMAGTSVVSWKWDDHPFNYHIRLVTQEKAFETKLLQIVEFILGKQVVLGRLVMEMDERILPWWLFYSDEEEDGDDDHDATPGSAAKSSSSSAPSSPSPSPSSSSAPSSPIISSNDAQNSISTGIPSKNMS